MIKKFIPVVLAFIFIASSIIIMPSTSAEDAEEPIRIVSIARLENAYCENYEAATDTNMYIRILQDKYGLQVLSLDTNDNPNYTALLRDGDILVIDGEANFGSAAKYTTLFTYLNTTSNAHYVWISKMLSPIASYSATHSYNFWHFTGCTLNGSEWTTITNSTAKFTAGSDWGLYTGISFYGSADSARPSDAFVVIPRLVEKAAAAHAAKTYQMTTDGVHVIYAKKQVNNIHVWYVNMGNVYLRPTAEHFDNFLMAAGVPLRQTQYNLGIDDIPSSNYLATTADYQAIIDGISEIPGAPIIDWSVYGFKEYTDSTHFDQIMHYLVNESQDFSYHKYNLDPMTMTAEQLAGELAKFDQLIANHSYLDKSMFVNIMFHGGYNAAFDLSGSVFNAYGYKYIAGAVTKYPYGNAHGVYGVPMYIGSNYGVQKLDAQNMIVNFTYLTGGTNDVKFGGRVYLHPENFINGGTSVDITQVNNLATVMQNIHKYKGSLADRWITCNEQNGLWYLNDVTYNWTSTGINIDNYVDGLLFKEKDKRWNYYSDNGQITVARYNWGEWSSVEMLTDEPTALNSTLRFTADYTAPVEISLVADQRVRIYDVTADQLVGNNISESGMLEFNAIAGHEYEIIGLSAYLSQQMDTAISPIFAIIPLVIIVGLIPMIMGFGRKLK